MYIDNNVYMMMSGESNKKSTRLKTEGDDDEMISQMPML